MAAFAVAEAAGAAAAGAPNGSAINAAAAKMREVLITCSNSHALAGVTPRFFSFFVVPGFAGTAFEILIAHVGPRLNEFYEQPLWFHHFGVV
ncbi:hypothetical protein [Hyphomicrobium nitrativorans]|uniref:hypothetical protein n=1 Tax=Hyphomicrobium nitrativorans TaxID=1427356 RepID=UPI0013923BDD|nr:hypothetical protein [Hyphomicrobium nitrativorans]